MNKEYLTRNIISIAIICVAIFFLSPIYITIHSNNGFQGFGGTVFLIVASVYSIIFIIILWLLIIAGNAFLGKFNTEFIIIFAMVWVVTSSFLFPLSKNSGMILPDVVPLDFVNLIFVFAIASLSAFLTFTKLIWAPYIFSIVISLGIIVEVFQSNLQFNIDRLYNYEEVVKRFSALSPIKNIIVLSFDGIPGNIVEDIFLDNDDLKYQFKDFTFFPNAFSTAPSTLASVTGELFGNRSFRNAGMTGQMVDLDFEKSLLPLNRLENSYVYGAYGSYMSDPNKVVPYGVYSNSVTNYGKFRDSFYRQGLSISRTVGSLGYRVLRKLKLLHLINSIAIIIHSSPSKLNLILNDYQNPEWKLSGVLEVYDFYGLIEALTVDLKQSDARPHLRMMHFTHTHFPVDFDENCDIRSNDKMWVDQSQNYVGLYNQGICELTQFIQLVNKLKTLGLYNNTMLILKSDHGEPATYYKTEPHALKINGNPLWGVNRYMPLLMIKDFNSLGESVKYNPLLVGLSDIARTICQASDLDKCENFIGVDLTSVTQGDVESNPYIYVDVVMDENTNAVFDVLKTIKFDRRAGKNILELLQSSRDISLE